MSQFRCKECRQLQFKYRIRGNKLEIEVKCYNDNVYNYFTIWLNKLNTYTLKNDERISEKEFQKDGKNMDILEAPSKNIDFEQKNRNKN